MADKQKKNVRRDRDSEAIIYAFIAVVFILCILVFIYKLFSHGNTVLQTLAVMQVLRWVFLGLGVVSAGVAVYRYRSGGKNPFVLLSAVLFLAGFSCWAMAAYFLTAVKFLCGFYVVAGVVFLIRMIYRAEFFTVSLLIAVTGLSLWMMLMVPGTVAAWVALVIGLICCVLYVALLVLCRRGGGTVTLGGKDLEVYGSRTGYGPMLICGPVSAVALVLGILGTTFAYYTIIAMVCVAFVYAVYYTVKLM